MAINSSLCKGLPYIQFPHSFNWLLFFYLTYLKNTIAFFACNGFSLLSVHLLSRHAIMNQIREAEFSISFTIEVQCEIVEDIFMDTDADTIFLMLQTIIHYLIHANIGALDSFGKGCISGEWLSMVLALIKQHGGLSTQKTRRFLRDLRIQILEKINKCFCY